MRSSPPDERTQPDRSRPLPISPRGEPPSRVHALAAVLREERQFSQLFGGYSVEVPEGHLVVNEKVPVPRFNFVQNVRCSPGRVAAFMERTLEHYYQRALRPTFELPTDTSQPAVEKALRLAGYEPRGEEHRRHLLVLDPPSGAALPPPRGSSGLEVEVVGEEELDTVVDLLVEAQARFREEVRRYLEVAMSHPNPRERVVPYLARTSGGPVSSGILLAHRASCGLFGVGTQTSARERGFATTLVAEILRREQGGLPGPLCISAEGRNPPRPLLALGFELWASFDVYALSADSRRQGF